MYRAVYRNFAKGERIWGMEKRGGAEADNSKNLINVRGKNNTRGGE